MIKFLKHKNKKAGFTLVETLVAISIFTSSIVVLMSVLGSGISNTNYAKDKITAGYLAQEGIEYLRNARDQYLLTNLDSGWTDFKTESANLATLAITVPPPAIFNDPGFVRTIQVTPDALYPDVEIKITSTVSWTQPSGATASVTLSETLFNWIE